MSFKKVAVLTSKESWFVPYGRELVRIIKERGLQAGLFFNHKEISNDFEVIFILSYFRIIDKESLSRHKHNLVIHESNLPRGKGWAPLFWQILEGKDKIPIILFEASEKADEGNIFIKDNIIFEGHELHNEIRKKQAKKTVELCLRFLNEYEKIGSKKQKGEPTFYKKRTSADSELDINKTLKEQFNLLRIVNNENFPAFFYHKGNKYILRIYKEKN